jgi:NADH:ubiquinone oxidoreductase subunit F (NADH-binding)
MLQDLEASLPEGQVSVEGVSCLGRCDRPPAACVALVGEEHEHYYLARSTEDLTRIVKGYLAGTPETPDRDADLAYPLPDWQIDSYNGEPPRYEAIQKAVRLRDEALARSTEALRAKFGWGPDRLEQFRHGAVAQLRTELELAPEVETAVRAWQTEDDWAKGNELGGWSEALLSELGSDRSDLRGLGGAGIPAIQKWRDVRDAIRTARSRGEDDRGFIVVNGDESEAGTFKDREILLRMPHVVLEGVILAGLITEATQGFIYIRHEYGEQIEACRKEIQRAERLGFCGPEAPMLGRPFPVSVFVSPGGYICGEQSALIEAMSDRRGEPRNMPPKLETNGLIDLPTLVSNVETYGWAPYIINKGGEHYAKQGVNGWKGRRFFSISGDVKRPGVYEVPMGMTLRELIYDEKYCGGMINDLPLKGFAPSGPSGGFLPARLTTKGGLPRNHTENKSFQALGARRGWDPATAQELDILDLELELNLFRALSPTSALGAGVVVYAEGRDMMEQTVNSLSFYRNESCGKCVPCRLGSQKLVSLSNNILAGQVTAERWKTELTPMVKELGKAIELSSICGLGRSVPVPILTTMNFFAEDLARHLGGNGSGATPSQS